MRLRGRGTREGTVESLWELELEPLSGTQYFIDPSVRYRVRTLSNLPKVILTENTGFKANMSAKHFDLLTTR